MRKVSSKLIDVAEVVVLRESIREVELMMLQGWTKLKLPGDREEALTNATARRNKPKHPKSYGCALHKLTHLKAGVNELSTCCDATNVAKILDRTLKLFSGRPSTLRRHSYANPGNSPNVNNRRRLIDREVRTCSPDFGRARMAFSSANASGNSAFGGRIMTSNNAQSQTGPDLEEIQTEVSSASWNVFYSV